MSIVKELGKNICNHIFVLFKWIFIAFLVGIIGGIIGSIFHICIDYVTHFRENNTLIIWFLPLGGLIIVFFYKLFKNKGVIDTNRVIDSVRDNKEIPIIMLPLIYFGTIITHLFGGSAGREGAALQIGGSIGFSIGKLVKLKNNDIHIVIMSGMSAVFAALFGTPITATFFSLEVTNVGQIRYAGFFPCVLSALVSSHIAKMFNISPVIFKIPYESVSINLFGSVVVLSILCAVLSIVFCFSIKSFEHLFKKHFKNAYYRAFIGGAFIVLLTIVLNTNDYNGAGMSVIERAISGYAKYEAPILKIIFTIITISAGFKGGEIVPTFFIGATFGCVMSNILGIEPSISAAIGFVALFCGVVNCPIASIFLAFEVFGAENIYLFAVAVSVSYMFSGRFGLYKSQKILYSKINDELIDLYTN